jgi:phosphoserine phosphatase
MKKELWFLDIRILLGICFVLLTKYFTKNNTLFVRSKLKRLLLKKLDKLPTKKCESYIQTFRQNINNDLVNQIRDKNYEAVIIASGSEFQIIDSTLKGFMKYDKIIANDRKDISDEFRTCWGENKLKMVTNYLINPEQYEIDVYSDSFDDLPLMQLGKHSFIVKNKKVVEYDINIH